MDADRISRLSARQRECLRLVLVRRGSKEIARELAISIDMVDKHIKTARETLGVSSRFEAARLLAESEGVDWVQKLDPRSQDLLKVGPRAQDGADEPGEVTSERGFGWPVPTVGRPWNDLKLTHRIGWIIVIAAIVATLAAGLASGSVTLLQELAKLI